MASDYVRRVRHCSPIHAAYFADTIHAELSILNSMEAPACEIFMWPNVWDVLAEDPNWSAITDLPDAKLFHGVPVTVRELPTEEVVIVGARKGRG